METGHVAAARLLLEAEAKVDACESVERMTPLFVAAARGQPLHCLLPSGGSSSQRPARSQRGVAPLFVAAKEGHGEIVCFLIESGADSDATLEFASQLGHGEVVRRLAELGDEEWITCAKTGSHLCKSYYLA